jgi:hypothetical protein
MVKSRCTVDKYRLIALHAVIVAVALAPTSNCMAAGGARACPDHNILNIYGQLYASLKL